MKRYLFIASLVCLVACSSDRTEVEKPGECSLEISIGQHATKASEAYSELTEIEKAANDVKIVVFDLEGNEEVRIEEFGTATEGNIRVKPGKKNVYAVVNGPDIPSGISEAELKKLECALLEYNDPSSGFVQFGSNLGLSVESGEHLACEIGVKRLVCRVHLASVSNLMPPALGELDIKSAYLLNVKGCEYLGGGYPEATSWVNQNGTLDSEQDLVYQQYSGPLNLYTYANAGSSLSTMLCLVAEVCGETSYYPMDLGELEANKAYTVDVNIYNLGSDDPATPLEHGAAKVSVKLAEWDGGDAVSTEI